MKSLWGDETILVIDDEDTVRQAAKSALESYGYKVVVAADGKEGWRYLRNSARVRCRAVGYDHAGDVGRRGAGATEEYSKVDIPVVLSSGYEEADATRRLHGKGLAGFIQKPYAQAWRKR